MQLTTELFESLRRIPWFSNCGRPADDNLGLEVDWVSDWTTATKCFSDPEWENTTLEARNVLTSHLAKRHAREYQEWNKLVRKAKEKLESGVYQIARDFQQKHRLTQTFVDCVKWDGLGMVMEETYKECRPPMLFFGTLLAVYERGRFPCGWKGEWPNGRLIVI
jgi:hypothetical protein